MTDPKQTPTAVKDVKTVFVFRNGMIAVCGWDGQQIAELQGKDTSELRFKIAERASGRTTWEWQQ